MGVLCEGYVCVKGICVFWVMMRRGIRNSTITYQPMLFSAEKYLLFFYNINISQKGMGGNNIRSYQ